jgi:hypothetical protein
MSPMLLRSLPTRRVRAVCRRSVDDLDVALVAILADPRRVGAVRLECYGLCVMAGLRS